MFVSLKKTVFVSIILLIGLFVSFTSLYKTQSNQTEPVNQNIATDNKESNREPIQKKIFGYSEKDRPIEGYEIGFGADTIMLLGAVHGNEETSADLLNKFIEEIKADISLVSPQKKVVVIPIVNPDGFNDRDDKLNANGVNLNLNFETTGWSQYGDSGTFAGEKPFTENESLVIKKVVEEYQPNMMISFHAQGSLVSPETDQASVELGKWYAEKTGYTYFDEWDHSGTATKWFVETTGKSAITVELEHYLELENDWEENKEALLELIA